MGSLAGKAAVAGKVWNISTKKRGLPPVARCNWWAVFCCWAGGDGATVGRPNFGRLRPRGLRRNRWGSNRCTSRQRVWSGGWGVWAKGRVAKMNRQGWWAMRRAKKWARRKLDSSAHWRLSIKRRSGRVSVSTSNASIMAWKSRSGSSSVRPWVGSGMARWVAQWGNRWANWVRV